MLLIRLKQLELGEGKDPQLGNEHHEKYSKQKKSDPSGFWLFFLVVDSYPAVVFTPEAVSIRCCMLQALSLACLFYLGNFE